MKTKTIILLLFFILFQFCLFCSTKKILVIGIKSKFINDIQNRVIREEVMRKFIKNGFNIVTVMELMSATENQNLNLSTLDRKRVAQLTMNFDADYAIFSELDKYGESKYKLTIHVYKSKSNQFYVKKIFLDYSKEFNKIAPIVSDKLYENSKVIIEEK